MSNSSSGPFTGLLRSVAGPEASDGPIPITPEAPGNVELSAHEEIARRAQRLLNALIIRLELDAPAIISYRRAYRLLSGESGPVHHDWSMACAKWLLRFSAATEPVVVRRLGRVRLETFLVNASTRRPWPDHWQRVGYDQRAWEAILGNAELWPDDELKRNKARR